MLFLQHIILLIVAVISIKLFLVSEASIVEEVKELPKLRILTQGLPDKKGTNNDEDETTRNRIEEGYRSNKTSKILTGPSRPRPPYGQTDGYGDLASQGSGNAQSIQNHPSISPIDMQLLSAMEKLIGRIDALDNRVKTLESIVHFLTGKDKPNQQQEQQQLQRGSCPDNFVKIDGIKGKCYHISTFTKSPTVSDWKSAAGECGNVGGRLVEMLSYADYHRIATFLAKYTNTRNTVATDFWTGGLNPGLIWIWSESGQQIDLDKRYWNDNDNSSNAPGCLKLSYSIRLNTFFFKGAPCSQTQNFLCEVLDNSVARALASFEKDLLGSDDDDDDSNDDMELKE